MTLTLPIKCLQNKQVVKKTTRSAFGKYLRGHVFRTTYDSQDPQHCLADCWKENELCQSFNFLVDLGTCELNTRTQYNAPDDYIERSRSVYLTNPRFRKPTVRNQ